MNIASGSRIVTYSPKVFIPLTHLCRDRCGYCTFASAPRDVRSPFMTKDEVLAVAQAGAAAGCHEALFTLGEAPETRYVEARRWLADHEYETTVDYIVDACAAVIEQTGLLPHVNAGALSHSDLRRLRTVAPSQGMMIETLREGLTAHRGAPDKSPSRRMATLESAGELKIPFTTGLLVGIGEERADRIQTLEAIAESHARHGHVQEVIVQGFLPKQGTAMRRMPPCSLEDLLDAIRLAGAILPEDIAIQSPPNLVGDLGALLDAGVQDLGGISPVTPDFVNPERPWPSLSAVASVCESRGFSLVSRLTVHPSYVLDAEDWIDPDLRFAVLDRSDAAGYARDDHGSLFPERYRPAADGGTGPEVVSIGRRSTMWAAGQGDEPPALPRGSRAPSPEISEVLQGIRAGEKPGEAELATLFTARGNDVALVASVADELRRQASGEEVTFVVNRNINYTNVCTFRCTFCGFSKGPASLNLRGRPYLLDQSEIAERVREAAELGATEVCLQGGIHPDFDGDFYLKVLETVREAAPNIHIHGFTALEVTEGARRLGIDLRAYLQCLKDAGLSSLPGTAAEILDDEVRAVICPDKVTTSEWLDCHETAHELGLRSNVTIMFGHVERPIHWVRHLLRTRELQERTGGFTEFIPLPFVHMASPMYLKRHSRRGPTWREVVLMHSVGRIAYRGSITNVQASWVKLGPSGVRQLLNAGANDLGGTLMEESISRAAGASHGAAMGVGEFQSIVGPIGRPLVQRTTSYGRVEALAEALA